MGPDEEHEIEMMEKYVGSDGEEGGETGASQQKRSRKSKLNTDSINYTGTGSSNNSNNDIDNNTMQRPDDNENKMIDINNIDYVGVNFFLPALIVPYAYR